MPHSCDQIECTDFVLLDKHYLLKILIVFSVAGCSFLVMVVLLKILSLKLLILRGGDLPTNCLVKTRLPILIDAKKALINMLRSNHV